MDIILHLMNRTQTNETGRGDFNCLNQESGQLNQCFLLSRKNVMKENSL